MNGLALYAGYGGLDLAIQIACPEYRAVCYIEREASCAALLVARMEAQELHQAPIWDDSGTFDGKPWRGKVDIITAGFPCPAVSVAGNRKGITDEKWLWQDVARIICEVEPESLLLENVRGLTSANDGAAMRDVLADLARMGFDVVWGSVPAKRLGAAHSRDRIFIVANANGIRRRAQSDASIAPANVVGGGSQLGDTACGDGQRQRKSQTSRSIPIGGPSGDVGDPKSHDRWCEQQSLEQSQYGRAGSAGTGCTMGNTDCQRCREAWDGSAGEKQVSDWYGGGLPFSPPGPNEEQKWFELIRDVETTPQPAVYGVADGSSKRVDRLRMCGNGVDPLAGAYAWRVGQALLARERGE